MNLGTSLHWVSTRMSTKICLIEDDAQISYSDLWKHIETLASAFLSIGIKENDKVVILLPNCKEFIYSFYALARINAIGVPLSPHLTAFELKNIFDDCLPKAVITTSFVYDNKLNHLNLVGCLRQPTRFCLPLAMLIDGEDGVKRKAHYFKELFKMGKGKKLPHFSTNNSQIATINYTYRGLGKPLGAMLTHSNYHHGVIGYIRLTEVITSQRILMVTPISHIFTLVSCVIVSLLRGATIVIMKSFIPTHIFRAIQEHKIDFIIAVPTIYISLLRNYDKDKFDIHTLKYGITGGSYLSPELYAEIKKRMDIELLQGYGLTETMPIACNPRSGNKPESLGIPGHEVKVKIVDERGNELPRRKRGEIIVGGPTVMKGYYNKNGANKEFLKDGWFWTGDYGWFDKDGYLYFGGLKKDIAKIGGNNVDIKEVEDALVLFPGAKNVKVRAVDDELWGHQIRAEMDIASKKEVTERDVRHFCSNRLALYKIPRKIVVNTL